MLSCLAWWHANDKTNTLLNVRNWKWFLLPSIHHMRNMHCYFLAILCTWLTNVFNYIHVNINLDFFYFSSISVAIFKSDSFFVPLVYFGYFICNYLLSTNVYNISGLIWCINIFLIVKGFLCLTVFITPYRNSSRNVEERKHNDSLSISYL